VLSLATFDLVTFAASGLDFTATNLATSSITLTDTKQLVISNKPDGGVIGWQIPSSLIMVIILLQLFLMTKEQPS
jgi:hypothetical protein